MDIIKLENVSKIYRSGNRSVSVISNINLSIAEGSFLLLKGPSGVGKTTLLNIMGCLTKPTQGKVLIKGKDVSHLPEHFLCSIRREAIGFVFQQFNLIPGLTLLENILIPLLPTDISPKERKERGEKILSLFCLENRSDFDVRELSGGEQQRAAIGRALINDPDILLADEPTSNIDEENAVFLINLFDELLKRGKTLVISSHDSRIIKSADNVFNLS